MIHSWSPGSEGSACGLQVACSMKLTCLGCFSGRLLVDGNGSEIMPLAGRFLVNTQLANFFCHAFENPSFSVDSVCVCV